MKHADSQHGVSLVELLVAVAILATALTPLLGIFLQSLKTAEHAHKRTIATSLAREMSEEIRSKQFKEPDIGDNGALTFGLEASDGYTTAKSRQWLDDVDDYNCWCRGQDCDCTDPECLGAAASGLCVDNSPLEIYDGTELTGPGYTQYDGFTRKVRVYAIFPNVSTVVRANEQRRGWDPPEHRMDVGVGTARRLRTFKFYDLRDENFKNLTGAGARSARLSRDGIVNDGRGSPLRLVEVEVSYTGPVTPPITLKDTTLISLSPRRQN